MRELFTNDILSLTPNQVVSGVADQPEILHVLQGRLWITVEGVAHDYWLSAGETFAAPPGRLVVAEADCMDSRLQLLSVYRPSVGVALAVRLRTMMHRLIGSRQRNHAAVYPECVASSAHR